MATKSSKTTTKNTQRATGSSRKAKPVARKPVAKKSLPREVASTKAKTKSKPVVAVKVIAQKVQGKAGAKPGPVNKAVVGKIVSKSHASKTPEEVKKHAPASNKATLPKNAPAKSAPVKSAAIKQAPAKAVPAKTVPAKAPAPAVKPAVVVEAAKAVEVPKGKSKVLSREFLLDLANTIRAAVIPVTRDAKCREIVGTATSGDATFELDRVAEKALLTYLKNARVPVAYYSEDSGYTTFTNAQPQHLLIVDPIDGTRAAKSGFENCVVAIATTRVIERPVMADVDSACVVEILGNRTFYAERDKGVRILQDGHVRRFKGGDDRGLETLAWSMTVPARPAELIFPTAAKLIDLTSLKGGFFACNSTSYSLTRLLTNQLDACVDVANRFYRDIPDLVRDLFINAGRGTVLGIEPYDLAAGLLVALEGGCTVTDAYGKSFDNLLLLDTSVENQRSMIAAANNDVHGKLLSFFDQRVRQWEELLRSRAERAQRLAMQQHHAKPAPREG